MTPPESVGPATRVPSRAAVLMIAAALLASAGTADAARRALSPISDSADGHLVDGTFWDAKLAASTVDDLLLTIGNAGGSRYDAAIAFPLDEWTEGETPADARLRLTEQGGAIGDGFTIRVTAARVLDPLAVTDGAPRFALPRTDAAVLWSISAPWDSAGQLAQKWDESPNLAPILEELLAQPGWDASPRVAQFFLEPLDAGPTEHVRSDDTHVRFWNGGNAGIPPPRLRVSDGFLDAFQGRELLCRPRPDRMEISLIPHEDAEILVEWRRAGATSWRQVGPTTSARGEAHGVVLTPLSAGADYEYRVLARPAGANGGTWDVGLIRNFRAMPGAGSDVRFIATADIHVTNLSFGGVEVDLELLDRTLDHALDRGSAPPHFWLDLGDLAVIRATRVVFDQEDTDQRYREARERIERIAHSVPFILVRGNHEEVTGWDDDGTEENNSVWSGRALKKWFPPPLPDDFYSGNEVPHPHIGLPGNFFAFTAGRIRIRCADPFLFTVRRPHNGHGEVGGSGDGWDWTLGNAQYRWLARDLAEHPGPLGVFALHHLSSTYSGGTGGYGRGGIEVSKYRVAGRPSFEWGGEDESGVDVLASHRPGFGSGSVHDLLVAGGTRVLLKGHDHFAAIQQLDDLYYLTLPRPDDTGTRTGDLWGWRQATAYPEEETVFHENSGFLDVTVAGTVATWEYVRTWPDAIFGTVDRLFSMELPAPSGAAPWEGSAAVVRIRNVSPNPFRSSCLVSLEIGQAGRGVVDVVDVAGRRIATLADRVFPRGPSEVLWDGTDRRGRPVPPGVYFVRLERGDRVAARRMVVHR